MGGREAGWQLRQPAGTKAIAGNCPSVSILYQEVDMGRGILLWLLGVPIPIIILLMLFMR